MSNMILISNQLFKAMIFLQHTAEIYPNNIEDMFHG